MGKFEWKNHFGCIIILLVSVIIVIVTASYGGKNNEMVSYVGFAGTIVSIILSTLAIIYAFYQTFSSGTFMSNLQQATRKIEETTESFKSVQSDLLQSLSKIEN